MAVFLALPCCWSCKSLFFFSLIWSIHHLFLNCRQTVKQNTHLSLTIDHARVWCLSVPKSMCVYPSLTSKCLIAQPSILHGWLIGLCNAMNGREQWHMNTCYGLRTVVAADCLVESGSSMLSTVCGVNVLFSNLSSVLFIDVAVTLDISHPPRNVRLWL